MSFDSITLRAVIQQLNQSILNGEITSVLQFSNHDFILRILANKRMYSLLFSVHPIYARVHLTEKDPKKENLHFGQFLQTHIRKGKISLIEQIDFDRIIRIRIIPYEEEPPKVLIAEFMGKHSNAILLDEKTNRILESIKHIDEHKSKYRQVLPGETYKPPPSNQNLDILSVSETIDYRSLMEIKGMSPLLAKEIIARAKYSPLEEIFMQIRDDITKSRYYPNVVINDKDEVIAVWPFALKQYESAMSIPFSDISNALEYFYDHLIEKEIIESEKNSMLQTLKKKLQDLNEKQDTIGEQLNIDAESLRIKGQLILANLQNIRRGQKEVSLSDPYDPQSTETIIVLDEKLSPSDNAQQYFEKYKKAKRSKSILEKIYDKNKSMIQYLQDTMEKILSADDRQKLSDIREELIKNGILKEKSLTKKKEIQHYRIFISSDNYQIYVGRNDKENDMLIKETASKYDMWLHAKQIEGSHVIIRNPERKSDIPKRTLLESAIIASYFSKARHSSIVPVDYTWIKYVTKPKGSKPGYVHYTHEKTLFVSPEDFNKIFVSKLSENML